MQLTFAQNNELIETYNGRLKQIQKLLDLNYNLQVNEPNDPIVMIHVSKEELDRAPLQEGTTLEDCIMFEKKYIPIAKFIKKSIKNYKSQKNQLDVQKYRIDYYEARLRNTRKVSTSHKGPGAIIGKHFEKIVLGNNCQFDARHLIVISALEWLQQP